MIGRTLLHYTITEQLGEGGMGIVYKARDKRLNRTVVVKTLRPDRVEDPEKKKRFVQEAQAASALNHPNIVIIHDIASVDDIEFIVMEYVQGRALDCIIPDGGLDVYTAIKYAVQIASALEAAHSSGIIHRDLKPGNVMVTAKDFVKLLDFGLAKLMEKPKQDLELTMSVDDRSVTTVEGALVGTIAYMSPEQALGDNLDGRSDLFSFGSVLYEMVTGQRAFKGASAIATLCAVLREDPPPPATLNSSVSPVLNRLIMRCLEKQPADRFNSALEIQAELEALLSRRDATAQSASSMAVLPFANLSGDARLGALCEGLSKDIAGALTRVPTLRVIVPAAAGLPVERPLHGPAIGHKLRADLVLDGNVRTAGSRIRITVELVSVADGYHVWSERYDRDVSDVFAMQDSICRDIVNRVRRHLEAGKPITTGPPDRSFAEGRSHLERFTSASLPKAKECFEEAVLATRNSAPVYAAIAEYYVAAALLGVKTSGEAMPKAEWAALKALSIDAGIERAHACLGIVAGLYEHNWEKAAGSFRRGLEINPGSASVRQAYALWHLIPLGHIPEAAIEMQKAQQAEPRSPMHLASLAYVCYLNGEYEESSRLGLAALEIDARFWLAHWVLGWALLASWRNEAALEHARAALAEDPSSGWTKALHAAVCSVAGVRDETGPPHGAWDAVVRLEAGDDEEAFRCAARAVQERDALIPFVIRHPLFHPYHPDPRYLAVASRMRIPIATGAV